jgi:hypothetical protein
MNMIVKFWIPVICGFMVGRGLATEDYLTAASAGIIWALCAVYTIWG